jgi:hypothetical protein
MSETSRQRRTADEWTALIEAYLASGLTQQAFCAQQGISFHGFRHRYRRSPLFRGKRRRPRASGFQQVVVGDADAIPALQHPWVVRVGKQVRVECPPGTPVEAIVGLARGLADGL